MLNLGCWQVSAFLLKDCSPNESLADQSLRAAFARFTGADDIASASDSREVACTPRDGKEDQSPSVTLTIVSMRCR